ncbi:MAG: glutamate-1-semialdehyde 2,1-aminomutase [Bacteroidota bacterium]
MISKTSIDRKRSAALFEEAKQYFPGGVNSPVRAFKSVSGPPVFIKSGKGCRIVDEDNNEYIDFCGSWGPLILGHAHPEVIHEITHTIQSGTSFGAPTALGNEIGKFILANHGYIEKIRFVSSGTEAVMSAIRLARGYSGKNKIVKFEGCYHGHVDSLLVKAGSGLATLGTSTSAGIPESFVNDTIVLPLNNLEIVEEVFQKRAHEIACVIIEPIPANNGLLLQAACYLRRLKEICAQYDVLLIFDEVISGFRVGFEGASGIYKVQADIYTFGKIIGGGLPVGAYASSHKVMGHVAPDGPVYQAGTLSANPVAMAAGLSTLKILNRPNFYTALREKTQFFIDRIQSHIDENKHPIVIQSIGSIFWINFSKNKISSSDQIEAGGMEFFKVLHHELLQRGVYLGPSGYEVGFISDAHKYEDLIEATNIINECLDIVFK